MTGYKPKHSSAVPKRTKHVEKGLATGTLLAAALIPTPFTTQNIVYANTATDREAFIQEVGSRAQEVANANGLYASVMIAQAIHESNWGQSQLATAPYYNIFGVKGTYNGQSVTFPTQEYLNGQWVTVNADFRAYPSYAESLQDNAKVLKTTNFGNGFFYAGAWKENTNSYLDATSFLTGRYATDPNYGNALNTIIAAYDLTRFDSPENTETPTAPVINETETGPTFDYTVKAGDTLFKIANEHQTTVEQIKSINQLITDNIYINQSLKIPGTRPTTETESENADLANPSVTEEETPNTSGEAYDYYTVKAGDSLWKIANQQQTTVEEIKTVNQLSTDIIYINQMLKIPKNQQPVLDTSTEESDKTDSNLTETEIPDTTDEVISYTVKAGDSLWKIANDYQTTVADIKALNQLTGNTIYVNQTLQIPKAGTSSFPQQEQVVPKVDLEIPKNGSETPDTSSNDEQEIPKVDLELPKAEADTPSNSIEPELPSEKTVSPPESSAPEESNEQTVKPDETIKSDEETVEPKEVAPEETFDYKVKVGDTLWEIANDYQTSVDKLKTLNALTFDTIYVNQTLKVPKTEQLETAIAVDNSNNYDYIYSVVAGDSLWKIATDNNVSINQLKTLNQLTSDTIYINQQIKVPASTTKLASPSATEHTVKAGDTLWGLSQTYQTSVSELQRLNNISGSLIYVGQTIKIK